MKKILENKYVYILLQLLPFAAVVIFIVVCILTGEDFSVESLISYTPENYFLATLFILFIFAAQSLSVFMPCVAVLIVTGRVFPAIPAILLNFVGAALSISIAYWVGYFSGSAIAEPLLAKYPKAKKIIERQRENEWFVSYFLRVVNFLPVEAVSMYLGAIKITYHKYMTAGMLGMLPGILLATLVGVSITDPKSPMFIVSVTISLIISGVSLIVYKCIYEKKNK